MKKLFFLAILIIVTTTQSFSMQENENVFSVSESEKVVFSKGNLQYQASTDTWRFAENPWDYIGEDNSNISSSYSGWIDLFGWGTGNNPTQNSEDVEDYSEFYDWGDYCGLPTPTGTMGMWRTLTLDELNYVMLERTTPSGVRYAHAKVNNICGMIIIPDSWTTTTYGLNNTNDDQVDFDSNVISANEWMSVLEPAGCVFLPAAGNRYASVVNNVGSYGLYWLSTPSGFGYASHFSFYSGNYYLDGSYYSIDNGFAVRLVAVQEDVNTNQSVLMQVKNDGFSVSESKKVVFAEGNLQYQASTDTWRFAENPWDYIGEDNSNISSSYSGWIDLFGWGTGDFPTKHSIADNDYDVFEDWGNYCKLPKPEWTISNWRTLSRNEWDYLMFKRNTPSGIRFAKAQVNEVNGIILLPDMWNDSTYSLNNKNNKLANFVGNVISATTWTSVFETEGCVFLPASGSRNNTNIFNIGTEGLYWSSTPHRSNTAYRLYFDSGYFNFRYYDNNYGFSVRLVTVLQK